MKRQLRELAGEQERERASDYVVIKYVNILTAGVNVLMHTSAVVEGN